EFAVGVQNVGETQLVGREISGEVGDEFVENRASVRPAYAYYTDAATPGGSGDGGDRYVGRHHSVRAHFLLEIRSFRKDPTSVLSVLRSFSPSRFSWMTRRSWELKPATVSAPFTLRAALASLEAMEASSVSRFWRKPSMSTTTRPIPRSESTSASKVWIDSSARACRLSLAGESWATLTLK